MAIICPVLNADVATREKLVMALLLLEALGALLLLVFIVWWTMFSGRQGGELKNDTEKVDARDEREK
jgi:hypothetical protein